MKSDPMIRPYRSTDPIKVFIAWLALLLAAWLICGGCSAPIDPAPVYPWQP